MRASSHRRLHPRRGSTTSIDQQENLPATGAVGIAKTQLRSAVEHGPDALSLLGDQKRPREGPSSLVQVLSLTHTAVMVSFATFVLGYTLCSVLTGHVDSFALLGPFAGIARWANAYYVVAYEQRFFTAVLELATGCPALTAVSGASTVVCIALANTAIRGLGLRGMHRALQVHSSLYPCSN